MAGGVTILRREREVGALHTSAPSLLLFTPLDGGRVVFFARDEAHGMEPWVMAADGASASMIVDLTPGEGSSLPASIDTHGDMVCFTLTTSARHCTDGTAKGTRKLPKPRSWPLSGGVVSLEAAAPGWALRDASGATLLMLVVDDMYDERGELNLPGYGPADSLWSAEEAKLMPPHRVWRGRLYTTMSSDDGDSSVKRVMVTDGTKEGTLPLTEPNYIETWPSAPHTTHIQYHEQSPPVTAYAAATPGFVVDQSGRLSWMLSKDGEEAWWSTDGTPANTRLAADALYSVGLSEQDRTISAQRPGAATSAQLMALPEQRRLEVLEERGGLRWFMILSDDRLVTSGITQATLFATDGTVEGTRELKTPGPLMVEPRPVLTNAGLVFSMDHPEHGSALFLWPAVPAQGK
jgi:ELWxxDGT repeat protein